MTDYDNTGYNYHSQIVSIDDTDYLVQGGIEDQLTMFREVDNLLECERDAVQNLPKFKDALQGEEE